MGPAERTDIHRRVGRADPTERPSDRQPAGGRSLNLRLYYPWFLAAAAVVPLIWWAWLNPRRRASIRFSSVERLRAAGADRGVGLRHVLPILRTLAVLLLVLSIARPQRADEQTRIQTEGIAIQLVV